MDWELASEVILHSETQVLSSNGQRLQDGRTLEGDYMALSATLLRTDPIPSCPEDPEDSDVHGS